jgi:hypothetical protein
VFLKKNNQALDKKDAGGPAGRGLSRYFYSFKGLTRDRRNDKIFFIDKILTRILGGKNELFKRICR